MANHSGEFFYEFTDLVPFWSDVNQTGVDRLNVSLYCEFSGINPYGDDQILARTASAVKKFDPPVSMEYLSGNLVDICNSLASGQNWWEDLQDNITRRLYRPKPVENPCEQLPKVIPNLPYKCKGKRPF